MDHAAAFLLASPQALCAGALTAGERRVLRAAAWSAWRLLSTGGGSAVVLLGWATPDATPGLWAAHVALMGLDLSVAVVSRFGPALTTRAEGPTDAAGTIEHGYCDFAPRVTTPDSAACAVRGVGTP